MLSHLNILLKIRSICSMCWIVYIVSLQVSATKYNVFFFSSYLFFFYSVFFLCWCNWNTVQYSKFPVTVICLLLLKDRLFFFASSWSIKCGLFFYDLMEWRSWKGLRVPHSLNFRFRCSICETINSLKKEGTNQFSLKCLFVCLCVRPSRAHPTLLQSTNYNLNT